MNHYQRLKDLREDHELKESDIAKLLGTTQQQVSKYEMGIQKMSILHYSLSYFIVNILSCLNLVFSYRS